MAETIGKTKNISFSVNILIKKEDGMFVAHCLELDIVAVGDTADQAQREVVGLICAQIDYAFSKDNLDHLYHPAPQVVWNEFYTCKEQMERKYKLEPTFDEPRSSDKALPPWLIAKTCQANNNFCHA